MTAFNARLGIDFVILARGIKAETILSRKSLSKLTMNSVQLFMEFILLKRHFSFRKI